MADVKTHHIHPEESNKEKIVGKGCNEHADSFGLGKVESKEEEKLPKEQGTD